MWRVKCCTQFQSAFLNLLLINVILMKKFQYATSINLDERLMAGIIP